LIDPLTSYADVDKFQFGFKQGHSVGLCTSMFKNTVDYYRSCGSHVFVYIIGFSTAFDTVTYWKLFTKLFNDNIDCKTVRTLAYWYSKQQCFVRWCSSLSTEFYITNGTHQGSLLSPYLLARYISMGSAVDFKVGVQKRKKNLYPHFSKFGGTSKQI